MPEGQATQHTPEQIQHLETLAQKAFEALPTEASKQKAAQKALEALPPKDKQKVAEQAGIHVGSASPETNDFVWRVVVSAFAIVLIGGAASLAVNVLAVKSMNNADILLSVFTAAAGFLGGLFAQLPGEKSKS